MESSNEIALRLKEVFLDGKWIANTNYKELLSTITWQQANTKISSLNTIAALTYHINYYLDGILNVFEGGALEIRDQYSFDFSPLESKEDWIKLLNKLCTNATKFAKQVELLPDKKLDEVFVNPKYGTYRRNIEAMIEHSYYHLGQISLIKKMIIESSGR